MEKVELRDYLAGQIASGWMAGCSDGDGGFNTHPSVNQKYFAAPAEMFYRMADAMLTARDKSSLKSKRDPYTGGSDNIDNGDVI